jgi:uncharacterized membrane protein
MLVVVFDNETKAYEGTAALRQLDAEGSLTVYGQAVILKQADGTATVKQADDGAPLGTLAGTSLGSVIGLLGGPVGLAIGSATGLAIGALVDLDNARVDADFIDEATRLLKPSKVAVVAEVEEEWTTPVDTRMEALGGTVLRRGLREVREKIRNEEIAAMKADLEQLKQELTKAQADRRARLQSKVSDLQGKIDNQQKKAEERWNAFQARQATKRELFKQKAVAAGRAIKELAKAPPV